MLFNAAAMALPGRMSTESSFEEDCALRVVDKSRIDEARYGLMSSVREMLSVGRKASDCRGDVVE